MICKKTTVMLIFLFHTWMSSISASQAQVQAMSNEGVGNLLCRVLNTQGDSFNLLLVSFLGFVLVAALWILFVFTFRKRVENKQGKSKLLNQQFADTMNLLFEDQTIDVFIGEPYTNNLYRYERGEYHLYTLTLDEYIKLIHPEDMGVVDVLKEKLFVKKENRAVIEFRHYNTEKKRHCYYEFIIAILERDSKGRVSRYAFSRRDCSKHKDVIFQQVDQIIGLNLSLQVGRLFHWSYDLALNTGSITDHQGQIHEINEEVICLIAARDRKRLFRYFFNVINDNGEGDEITIALYSLEHKEERNCRLKATLQKDKEGNPLRVYGILKDVTEEEKMIRHYSYLQENTQKILDIGEMITWQYDCKQELFIGLRKGLISKDSDDVLSKQTFLDNVHPDDKKIIEEYLRKLMAQELESFTHKFRYNTPMGWKWFLNQSASVVEDGVVTSIMGVRREVTWEVEYQKKLEEQITEFKEQGDSLLRILDSLPIPVAFKSLNTLKYTYVNEAYVTLYGVKIGDETPFKVKNSSLGENLDTLNKRDSYEAAEVIETKDGRTLNTIAKSTLIEYNGEKQLLVSRIDLTEILGAKRFSQLLNSVMPALKAFTWFFDTRTNGITMQHNMDLERDINYLLGLEQFVEIIHPDDRAGALDNFIKYMNQEEGGLARYRFRLDLEKIGVYEWWEYNSAIEIIKENGQEYSLVSGITINVNDRKNTELELLKLNQQNELILNNINSVLIYITPEYDVIWGNAETALSGKAKDVYKASETKCYRARGLNEPCENCPVRTAFATQQMAVKEFKMEDNDWIKITAIPVIVTNGLPQGAILRIDNVTEYKRLIGDLETSMAKAEESDKLKSAFLANMSHEIRTPLNAIVGFSGLLQVTDDLEEKEEYIRIINSNNELLLRLIGDILDLSKIDAGTMNLYLETFDFSFFFDEIYTSLKPQLENSKIDFLISNPFRKCIVTLDKNRCLQIITNYLNNAIKFTQKGHIKMEYDYKDSGLIIFVEDTGIGVPESNMDLLFQRFEKLDSFAQGTGLGLSICKAIAETMGGKVGVDSTEGEGSTFWVWLPCEADVEEEVCIRRTNYEYQSSNRMLKRVEFGSD